MEAESVCPEDEGVKNTLVFMTQQYANAVQSVMGVKDSNYQDFMARRLVVMGYLLLEDTQRDASFRKSLHVYVNYGQAEVAKHADFIGNFRPEEIENYLIKE